MSQLVVGEEQDVEFLAFRQLSSGFTASVRSEVVPDYFNKVLEGPQLAIHDKSSQAFWATKEGIEYAKLESICTTNGPAKGEVLLVEGEPAGVYIHKEKLVVSCSNNVFVFDISDLKPNSVGKKIDMQTIGWLTFAGEYICGITEGKKLVYCKMDEDEGLEFEELSDIICIAGYESKNELVAAKRDLSLIRIELPTGTFSEFISPPEGLKEVDDSQCSLKIINETSIAFGIGENQKVFIIKHDGSGGATWFDFDDRNRNTGSHDSFYLFSNISGWSKDLSEFLIIGDNGSPDVVCGGFDENGEYSEYFIVDEEGLLQMPLSKINKGDETFPVAIALDFSNGDVVKPSNPDDNDLPPQPVVWILNSDGVFCPFRVVRNDLETSHLKLMPKYFSKKTVKPVQEVIIESLKTEEVEPKDELVIVKSPIEELKVKEDSETPEKEISKLSIKKEVFELEPDEEPLVPIVSKLTEDLGLLQNAITGEMVTLYESFNGDLDQTRSMAVRINDKIVKERPLIASIDKASLEMANLSLSLERELKSAVERETRLISLFENLSKLESTVRSRVTSEDSASKISSMLERLEGSLDKTEELLTEAKKISDIPQRHEYIKSIILPEFEEILDLISDNSEPIVSTRPTRNLLKFGKWSSLHEKMRVRTTTDLVTKSGKYEASLPKVKADNIVQIDISKTLVPLPKPLALSFVALQNIKDPKRISETMKPTSAPMAFNFGASTSMPKAAPVLKKDEPVATAVKSSTSIPLKTESFTFKPFDQKVPIENAVLPAVVPKAEKIKPVPTTLFSFKPDAVADIKPPAMTAFSFNPIKEEDKKPITVTTSKPVEADEIKPALPASFSVKTVEEEPKKVEKPTLFTFTQQPEQPKPTTTEPIKPADVVETPKTEEYISTETLPEKPATTSVVPGTPEKTAISPSWVDVQSLDVNSPTPKGIQKEKGSGFGLTGLSLDASTTNEKLSQTSTPNTASSIFGLPTTVSSFAPPAMTANMNTFPNTALTGFGFKPSPLESVAPPKASIFGSASTQPAQATAAPFAAPATAKAESSGFGSLQSLGVSTSAVPAFGAPSAFGALSGAPTFGQSTTFGFQAPPAATSQASNTGGGFSSFASGSSGPFGFGAMAPIHNPSSIFGAASTQQQNQQAPSQNDASIFGSASASNSNNHQQQKQQDESKKNLPASFTQFRS